MDSYESYANTYQQIVADDAAEAANPDHGWQKVTYAKKHRKQKPSAAAAKINGTAPDSNDKGNVFLSLEQQSEDRRRRILESAASAAVAATDNAGRSRNRSDDDDDDDDSDDAGVGKGTGNNENGEVEKKVKVKKPKKPKVTVSEASAKIDESDLAAFLADISVSYEGQQEIQLMRFADYFGRAFSAVSSAQFPWVKLFRENPVTKIADIPLSNISEPVYKTSVDWISQRSVEALGSFLLWCLDSILADLAIQLPGPKAAKKGAQQASSKSQVAIFVVLAMVLRRKPDSLINVLPTLKESSKYQGQDKLPVIAWMITQASQADLAVGLFSWARNLLPLVSGKSNNPQSRDLILQLVEKILAAPKARTILVNGAVRKGERLVPPSALEVLMRVSFPMSSARVKATERFEAIYPTLKEVALAGSTGSKAMRQVALQTLSFSLQAAGESNQQLSKEAAGISVWCFTQNPECYKQWVKVYEDDLRASVAVLKRLSEEWKELSQKLAPFDPLRETIRDFRKKNEKAMGKGHSDADIAQYKEADKYCKAIQGRLSRGHGCLKGMAFAVVVLGIGAAVASPNMEGWDWKELSVYINSQLSNLAA
ncbi:Transmembrane protein 214-A [Linum grandiflorum]